MENLNPVSVSGHPCLEGEPCGSCDCSVCSGRQELVSELGHLAFSCEKCSSQSNLVLVEFEDYSSSIRCHQHSDDPMVLEYDELLTELGCETTRDFREKYPFKPGQLVWLDGSLAEVISYPIPAQNRDGCFVQVMVQETPGDPETVSLVESSGLSFD